MAAPGTGEKTEQPTAKRIRDAARRGEILKSRELGVALVTLAGLGYLVAAGADLYGALQSVLKIGLTFPAGQQLPDFGAIATAEVAVLVAPLAGLFGVTIVAAVLSQAVLGGLGFNASLFAPKPNRLNPAQGLARMFGINALIELGKSLLKVAAIGALGSAALASALPAISVLGRASPEAAASHVGALLTPLLFMLAAGLGLVALADVPLQALQRLGRLRMTRQEVRDEHKQTEGSPEAKAAIRQRQRQAIKRDVRSAIETASVIMTNPTHFAVALRYDPAVDRAPVVVARGRGTVAAVIRELAAERRKPVLSYPLLTRAIYFTSQVGEEVRSDLYLAVATVLAFVFDVDRRLAEAPPTVDVPEKVRFDESGKPLGEGLNPGRSGS
jgi:flagellar biosynthetic protein FlhB